MTNLIEQIKRDREVGTPGGWISKRIHQGEIWANGNFIACCWTTPPREETWRSDTLRIARVPELEAALLAAETLVARVDEWSSENLTDENCRDWFGHVEPALAAYRRATGGDND